MNFKFKFNAIYLEKNNSINIIKMLFFLEENNSINIIIMLL